MKQLLRVKVRLGMTVVLASASGMRGLAAQAAFATTVDVGAPSDASTSGVLPRLLGGRATLDSRAWALALSGQSLRAADGVATTFGSASSTRRFLENSSLRLSVGGDVLAASRGNDPTAWRGAVRAGPTSSGRAGQFDAYAKLGRIIDGADGRGLHGFGLQFGRTFSRGTITMRAEQTSFAIFQAPVRDTTYYVLEFPFHSRRTPTLARSHYVDATTQIAWRVRGSEWALDLGARSGGIATEGSRWARIDAALPLGGPVLLALQLGTRPGIPELGLPTMRAAAVALRFANAWRFGGGLDSVATNGVVAPRVARFALVRSSDGATSVVLRRVRAAVVEVMGDFTGWEAVRMEPHGRDEWRLALRVAPGLHRVLLRVDGGDWRPPPDLPLTSDELDDRVGLLLVPS